MLLDIRDGWKAFIGRGVCSCVCRALSCIVVSVCCGRVVLLCLVCDCVVCLVCIVVVSCHAMYVYIGMYTRPSTQGFAVALSC